MVALLMNSCKGLRKANKLTQYTKTLLTYIAISSSSSLRRSKTFHYRSSSTSTTIGFVNAFSVNTSPNNNINKKYIKKSTFIQSNNNNQYIIKSSNIIGNTFLFSTSSSSNSEMSNEQQQKTVLIPIADGSEEIETVCIQDVLVRFGAKVTIVSIKENNELICTMSRGIKICADEHINNIDPLINNYNMIICPGGMPGAEYLSQNNILIEILKKQKLKYNPDSNNENQYWYGAICAAPAITLYQNQLIDNDMNITCYPASKFHDIIKDTININDKISKNHNVIISKNCITSKGPGTAIEYALTLGEILYGTEKRIQIAKELLFNV